MSNLEDQTDCSQNFFPKTYGDLIAKVGSQGPYQKRLLFIFALIWFSYGFTLNGNAFLFLRNPFDCTELELTTEACSQYREAYVSKDSQKISLSNYFARLKDSCDSNYLLQLVSTCTFLGSFVGAFLIAPTSSLYGHKKTLQSCLFVTCCGVMVMICSRNLEMIALGLFLCGMGVNSATTVTNYIICQVIKDQIWQRYLILLNFCSSLGSTAVTFLYYYFAHWISAVVIAILTPITISAILVGIYLEDTPYHLISKSSKVAAETLNRILKLNNQYSCNFITVQDIEKVKNRKLSIKKEDINQINLLCNSSFQAVAFSCCFIVFSLTSLYFTPSLFVTQIGQNPYVSNLVMNLSELIAYLPAYFFMEQINRKQTISLMFKVLIAVGIILMLLKRWGKCLFCLEFQLTLTFIFRFCVCFMFTVFNVFQSQLFPVQIRSTSISLIGSVSSISAIGIPSLLGLLSRYGWNPMTMMIFMGFLGVAAVSFVEETKGILLSEEIDFEKTYYSEQHKVASTELM